MKVYVDQSGKIENTSKPTVLAFTNKESFTLKVSPRVKRQLQEVFRRKGLARLFVYRIFASLVFLLIRGHLKRIDQVIIDTEYPGKEILIRDIILEQVRKLGSREPTIDFKRIGNKPKVHYAAYNVFIRKRKATKTVSF